MDELEKKAQKGLESYSNKGDLGSVKSNLDNLIDEMLGDEEDIHASKKKETIPKWLYMLIAVIGLSLIAYLGYKDGSEQKEKFAAPALYAQYFEVLPDAISANERGSEADGTKSEVGIAMEMYNKGDYKNAAEILIQQKEVEYLVFGAISEMKNSDMSSAVRLLLKSKQVDNRGHYKDIIEWYLSLAYLKDGKMEEAKALLTSISKADHYKSGDAKSILDSLQ